MAFPKHLRVERQVQSYFLVMGATLVGCFLFTVWLMSPNSEVIPKGSVVEFTEGQVKSDNKFEDHPGPFANTTEQIDGGVDESERKRDGKTVIDVQSDLQSEDVKVNGIPKESEPIKAGESETMKEKNKLISKQKEAQNGDTENKSTFQDSEVKRDEDIKDAILSEQVVDDATLSETNTAAESELRTENKETPKNWSTQATESTEEKILVRIGNKSNDDTRLGNEKNGSDSLGAISFNSSEDLPGKETEGEVLEDMNIPGQSSQKHDGQSTVGAKEYDGKETNEDVRGKEENMEGKFEVDGPDSIDHVKANKSEHFHGQEIREKLSNVSNGHGQALENSHGLPAGGQENTGKGLALDFKLCRWQGATDYIPCLDNKEAIKQLRSMRQFQHRERHCPDSDKSPLCLVPLPKGYRLPIRWPRSKNEIWYNNVPYPKLVSYKKDQNWVRVEGEKFFFPGGGTQFKFGASNYIDSVEKLVADVAWGKHTRVVLDIGCGVASFGGSLFERDVLTMSFAPKDEHEAQVQLALERGIPAISAVMGTQRLPFSSNSFDLVHCARCRIHWHGYGGKWLIEVNRVLRPGGYFVWSATPVYRKQPEDIDFWKAMVALTESMCWNLTIKAKGLSSGVGLAIYQKPTSNSCYEMRLKKNPPICSEKDNPDASWYTPLGDCLQKVPSDGSIHGAEWPAAWPERIDSIPGWLQNSQKSLFGQPANNEFKADTDHWRRVVEKSYLKGLGIDWASIRNVMDMKAGYGGFAAALLGQSLWVMNVVPIDEPDTLPLIFDRGLFGIYHNWCESFSTYPRTYDLLHVDHLFKRLVSRCKPVNTLLEMDRMLRPEGWIIFRDKCSILNGLLPIIESLHWNVRQKFVEKEEQLLVVQKTFWRP